MSDSCKPLTNAKHEAFARELATFNTVYRAAKIAGYNADGSSFKSNARRLAQNADIKARVAYLQRVSGIETAVDSAYIQRRLFEIANVPIDDDAVRISDQISALNLLAKIIGAFAPEKIAPTTPEGDAPYDPGVTDERRISALMALLEKHQRKA